MRIVCDACQAKYSISDDKVVGKVFKIRCKKCSNIIVVRGGAQVESTPAPAPALPDAPSDAIWHVVIDQDQVGPLTVDDLQQRLASNEIDGETFAWCEGMADWLPIAQIDELASLVAASDKTAHDYRGGGADAIHALAAASGDAPGDELFARPSSPRGDELFAARSSRGGHGAGGAASSEASSDAGPALRGARNESSVLFSLNNLAQIANKPSPAATPPSGTATSTGGGEGSGLIDIRSMASAYMGTAGAATKTATASSIGTIDDLPVFGGGGFSEPAVIVPTARPANNQRVMVLMIAALALLAVVAIVLVVILMKSGRSDPPPAVANTEVKAPDKAPDIKAEVKAPEPTEVKAPAEAKAPEVAPKHVDPPKHVDAPKHQAPTNDAPKHGDAPKHVDVPKQLDPKHVDAPPAKDECDQVTCAFNGNEAPCCAKWRAGKAADPNKIKPPPPSDLPDGLDVGMIQAGIGTIKASAMRCGDKSPAKGKVKVHLTVGGDGRVSAVSVDSSPDPALGACVQNATQGAKFAKTQHGRSFSYVFSF